MKRFKLNYFVILSLDINKISGLNLGYLRRNIKELNKMQITEKEIEEPEYYKIHRKFTGLLNPKQLKEFVENNFSSTCLTMGSITFEYGFIDAISFDSEYWSNEGVYLNAYISPVFSFQDEDEISSEFDKIPEDQRKYFANQIQRKMSSAFKSLEKAFENDFHFAKSIFINFNQLYLDLFPEEN